MRISHQRENVKSNILFLSKVKNSRATTAIRPIYSSRSKRAIQLLIAEKLTISNVTPFYTSKNILKPRKRYRKNSPNNRVRDSDVQICTALKSHYLATVPKWIYQIKLTRRWWINEWRLSVGGIPTHSSHYREFSVSARTMSFFAVT